MEEDTARGDLGDGLRQYMAMADECLKELQSSESPFVAVLLQYDDYFRRDLWQDAPSRRLPLAWVSLGSGLASAASG